MGSRNDAIRHRYNRIARLYNLLEAPMEGLFASERRYLASMCHGKVLEVGVGTGKNLPFYPADAEVTAVDFSAGMLAGAHRRLESLPNRRIELLEMDVQALHFPDDSFDCALSTCVFCSVPDPVQGLRELRRVVKPGGQIFMLEHVRSEHPPLGWLMDRLNPLPLHVYGANINRRTVENLRTAGFEHIEVKDLRLDVLKRIVVTNVKDERNLVGHDHSGASTPTSRQAAIHNEPNVD